MIVIACDLCRKNTNLTHNVALLTTKYKLDKDKKRKEVISVTMSTELIKDIVTESEEQVSVHACEPCRFDQQKKLLGGGNGTTNANVG